MNVQRKKFLLESRIEMYSIIENSRIKISSYTTLFYCKIKVGFINIHLLNEINLITDQ